MEYAPITDYPEEDINFMSIMNNTEFSNSIGKNQEQCVTNPEFGVQNPEFGVGNRKNHEKHFETPDFEYIH